MAKLTAVECREFIQAVVEKATEMGVPVTIAIVGPEGHLIALERMDDAGFITPDTARAKAFTVAAFRSMSPRFTDGLVIQQWFKERNPADAGECLSLHERPGDRLRWVCSGLQGRRDGRRLRHQRRHWRPGRGDRPLRPREGRLGPHARGRHDPGECQEARQRDLRQGGLRDRSL